MKKTLALLLVLAFVVSFAACKSKDAIGDNVSTGDASSEAQSSVTDASSESLVASTDDSSKAQVSSTAQSFVAQTSSAQTSSVESKPATPAKLSPKKNLKAAKYAAKYFSDDKQIYYEVSLTFYEELTSFQFARENYYTKEQCKKKYEGWGMEFDEQNFSYEFSKEVNGVTYYNLGDWDNVAELCDVTDTTIKLWPEYEGGDILSMNADGTLVVDKANLGKLKVGAVFTLVEE